MPGKTHEQRLPREKASSTQRIALSYSVFLVICLALVLVLYVSATRNARQGYWEHQAAQFDSSVATMNRDLAILNNYTRQFLTDSTFIRFVNMTGEENTTDFQYTAYEVMRHLASRMYGLMNVPVKESHIYLKNFHYVISSGQFTEAEQYYRSYRHLQPELYDEWMEMLTSATANLTCYPLTPYTGIADELVMVQDMNQLMNRSVPAVIWYELDARVLAQRFLSGMGESSFVLMSNPSEEQSILLSLSELKNDAAGMDAVSFDEDGQAVWNRMKLIRRESGNGWVYTLAMPERLYEASLGNYDLLFVIIYALALLFGAAMVAHLVRVHMRPLVRLDHQLKQVEGDKAKLEKEMDAQRPMLCASYLRRLLSGHMTSEEEFAYTMRFLNLEGDYQYYVLYCAAHQQDAVLSEADEYALLSERFHRHLDNGHPLYLYATLSRDFVVLVAYDRSVQDPLMDLQRRVLAMHEDLLESSLWFYAGVGTPCTAPRLLWESYEQARIAARYTGRSHIFLPYQFIRKDTESWYYPMELSSKLLRFITTGNKAQVEETFALLHRENMDERQLSVPLLNYLLSDLKNTLLKARFQLTAPQTEEERQRLAQLDETLSETPYFPQLESCALQLCECFTSAADASDPIPEIERCLQENYSDPSMCLSKLADQFNISESYLSHLFKNRTGQNFSVYLENLRLNEAARRLRSKDCNLSLLCQELGYTNQTTFRRAFKKRYGITPSEMRQGKAAAEA